MTTYADKTKEEKEESVSNFGHSKSIERGASTSFSDNRPEVAMQQEWQKLANNSPQSKQAAQLQAAANHHSEKENTIIAKSVNKTGLPDKLKSGIETLSGYSMDDVKVHRNSSKPAQLQAYAYAQGTNIHLAPGQEKHLPHEAWHVVQQKQGRVKPTVQMKGEININDDIGLEKEADVMGAKANSLSSEVGATSTKINASSLIESEINQRSVIQKSSEGDQTGDESEAVKLLQKALSQIAAVGSDDSGDEMMVDSDEEMIDDSIGFSDEAEVHDDTVSTDRVSIRLALDQRDGNGTQIIYISPNKRDFLHSKAEELGWSFSYTFQEVEYEADYMEPEEENETIQMAATVVGAFNLAAAKSPYLGAFNLANGSITYQGVNGKNVTTGVSGSSLNRQPNGSGVGTTRPQQWVQFLAMVGATNPFNQGHHMHQGLGGDGTHDNLAPFTSSLNGLHYHRAESKVKTQTDASGNNQFADYETVPTYGGTASIRNWGTAQFAAMNGANKLAALVVAGIITPATAAAAVGGVPTALQITAGQTWITNYINAAFPSLITCKARFIDHNSGTGTNTSTAQQTLTITNDF